MENEEIMQFKTYVVASEAESGPWSLAYVSQVYGTIFGVYTNIELEERNGRTFYRKIHFKLGNFKGLIMLGINKVEINSLVDPITGEKTLGVNLEVKGLEATRDFTVDLKGRGIEAEEGSKIEVHRHLTPLHQNIPESKGLFDTEFYYRDAPEANVVDFSQHARAFYEYKNGLTSEIRETVLSEYTPRCITATRYIKIE